MDKNSVTEFREAQDRHQQTLRRGILDDASNLLVQEGASALSMRKIAQLVGCSTTVLYTMFGSKQGLVEELYLRGFEMLAQALEAVKRPDNSRDYIFALCDAYRNFALANSTYYSIMFFKVIPEFSPSDANRHLGQESLALLVRVVQESIASEDKAWEIARTLWATLHGHVALELVGYFNDAKTSQQRLKLALQGLLNELL
jgi:AcrR family transcriptional regulator